MLKQIFIFCWLDNKDLFSINNIELLSFKISTELNFFMLICLLAVFFCICSRFDIVISLSFSTVRLLDLKLGIMEMKFVSLLVDLLLASPLTTILALWAIAFHLKGVFFFLDFWLSLRTLNFYFLEQMGLFIEHFWCIDYY